MTPTARLLVLAKEPLPGLVKTRLTPPFSPATAARLARAALEDTLDTVLAAAERLAADGSETEPVLVLSGRPWPGLDGRFRIVGQRGGGLDERLAAAFADTALTDTALTDTADGPALAEPVPAVLVGMDTPQLSADVLVDAVRLLVAGPPAGACLGLATDGGWWLLGLRRPDPELLLGLPMSQSTTGAATAARLEQAGCAIATLPVLRDVDTADDAALVAELVAPGSRFATTHATACAELSRVTS
jgi:glycosyltransferase A (GT-A) superfamily protein (DUF2064 family)